VSSQGGLCSVKLGCRDIARCQARTSGAVENTVEPNHEAPRTPQLGDYLMVLSRRKWWILSTAAVVLLAALLFSWTKTPTYQSEAQVLVQPVTISATQTGQTVNMDTQIRLAQTITVANLVRDQLRIQASPQELLRHVSVSVPTNTELLVINYSDRDPAVARQRAQAFADAYLTFRRQQVLDALVSLEQPIQTRLTEIISRLNDLNRSIAATNDPDKRALSQQEADGLEAERTLLQQRLDDLTPPESLEAGTVVAPADLPVSPSSPSLPLIGILGLLAGLALGVAAAFVRDRLDDRFSRTQQLAQVARTRVLGEIPSGGRSLRDVDGVVTLREPTSSVSEAYRILGTSFSFATTKHGIQTILVTSPGRGEGKTTTAANLGVVMARMGRRTILLSGDMRRPRLDRLFLDRAQQSGLSEVLSGESKLTDAIVPTSVEGLSVIPATGQGNGAGPERVDGEAMAHFLRVLREYADLILADSPPILGVADTPTLAELADGVLLVVDRKRTTRSAVHRARDQLDLVQAVLIGVVLNNFDRADASHYYTYGYSS
jgi:capsular exopolysaccharide synthesis family protein